MSVGVWEISLLVLVFLLVFGAGRLPKLMGDLATGIKSFKGGLKDAGEPPVAEPEAAEPARAVPLARLPAPAVVGLGVEETSRR